MVPFICNDTDEVTLDKLSKVNGVLYPGGGGDYDRIGKLILEHAKKMNDAGEFFPIWGTCLGFEALVRYTATNESIALEHYGVHAQSLRLDFQEDPRHTKMYCPLDVNAFKFGTGNYTLNSHSWSANPGSFYSDEGLSEMWDVTAHSYDENGKPFVA